MKNNENTVTLDQSISLKQPASFSRIKDLALLVKFRLASLVVFSAVMSYLIAAGDGFSWQAILALGLGGFLVTGAANSLNQVLEKDYDKLMTRTALRPLAAGRMQSSTAVLIAGISSVAGILLLSLFNPLTAMLGMLSLLLYSFVYTPLKRFSPLAVWVGAIPGALPCMIGVVAFEGEITFLAIVLFFIQFLWQFPHFWAIAWLADEDYKRAGFQLLPTNKGKDDPQIALQCTAYALALIPISILLFVLGNMGGMAFGVLLVAAVVYTFFGYKFFKEFNRKSARALMFCSFVYLPVVLVAVLLG